MSGAEDNDQDQISVFTSPAATGRFVVALEYSVAVNWTLTAGSGLRYARCLIMAAARAEHDAAVMRQMVSIETTVEEAAILVGQMRSGRSALTCLGAKVTFTPGVSAFDETPFVLVTVQGSQSFQMSPAAAREHAMAVLEAIEVAELDHAYSSTLQRFVGASKETAQQVVSHLPRYRIEGRT